MANVLVWATGLAGIALATSWAWRWRALPVVAERPAPDGRGQAALEGLRTVALSLWAGLAAGFLVPGCDLQRYVARFSQRYVAAPVVSLKGSLTGTRTWLVCPYRPLCDRVHPNRRVGGWGVTKRLGR